MTAVVLPSSVYVLSYLGLLVALTLSTVYVILGHHALTSLGLLALLYLGHQPIHPAISVPPNQ